MPTFCEGTGNYHIVEWKQYVPVMVLRRCLVCLTVLQNIVLVFSRRQGSHPGENLANAV